MRAGCSSCNWIANSNHVLFNDLQLLGEKNGVKTPTSRVERGNFAQAIALQRQRAALR